MEFAKAPVARQHRADFLAQEIGHRHRVAGGIGADQRARQIVVGDRGRVDADAERDLSAVIGSITFTVLPVLEAAIKHPVVLVVVPLLFEPQSVGTGS